jgi:hypothetical protein
VLARRHVGGRALEPYALLLHNVYYLRERIADRNALRRWTLRLGSPRAAGTLR